MIVALRSAAILLTFAAVLIPQLLLTLVGRRALIPPHFLQAIGWLAGLRVRRDGRPAPRAKGTNLLLVANHTSWLDILVLAGAARSAFVAKGELAGPPLLKWLCDQNDTLFIAREKRGKVAEQVTLLRSALAHRVMTIFPEGTTSDGSAILPFKSALFSAVEGAGREVIIQPVALDYEEATAIAWGDETGSANLLRILARIRPIRVKVHFLEPLAGSELTDRKSMTAAAQQRIGEALALPRALSESPSIA